MLMLILPLKLQDIVILDLLIIIIHIIIYLKENETLDLSVLHCY